jgi:aminoglycoside 6-adenylyltransferase
MIEWHAIVSHPKPIDTWHLGARMQAWTDQETWLQLQTTFGRFDADDARRAFQETTQLYSRLARAVAAHAAFEYPHQVEEKILALG